jgi:hypothetical protein
MPIASCARQRTDSMLDPGEDGGNGQPLLEKRSAEVGELKFKTIRTRLKHPEGGDWPNRLAVTVGISPLLQAVARTNAKEREERRSL